MKAIVTGTGGQLGRALLTAGPAGWDVIGLDRARLDLADPQAIARVMDQERPDLVINAAAYTAVDRAEDDRAAAQAVNGDAVGVIAAALGRNGGQLVQVSTDFVFDGRSSTPYPPDAARNPLSVYGATKASGEDQAGADAIICRTSWAYAAGGANFVRTMLRLMKERDRLNVVGDQIGAPTWARSLADTLWALADRGTPGEIYHHQDAGVASWYDFAVAIQEEALEAGLLDRAIEISPIASEDYPTPARRPAFSVLDMRSTAAVTGNRPTHWRENLRRMLKEESALG